jgi:predicted enzyme related to lactoylglutathione lyase
MARVTGLGGVFFKAKDPAALGAWYAKHLGMKVEDWGGSTFRWSEDGSPADRAYSVWSPFKADTSYFAPSEKAYMINLRVDDLQALLAQLRSAGCAVDPKVEESEFGKFGWVMDPEGNRVELWQPPERKRASGRIAAPSRTYLLKRISRQSPSWTT